MKHLDLFSGIGGFALATEMVWDNVEHIFCDNDDFSQAILKKHWPNAPIYGDIRTLTADAERSRLHNSKNEQKLERKRSHKLRIEQPRDTGIYLLTGGFPCQPFSQAGVRRGTNDDRHLWPEMFRVIREFQPRWVIAENVAGLLTIENGVVFEQVCADLESEGYAVQPFVVPACAVGAPHRRDRVWIVAHAERGGRKTGGERKGVERLQERRQDDTGATTQSGGGDAPDTAHNDRRSRQQRGKETPIGTYRNDKSTRSSWSQNWPEVAARLCRLDDGLPNGLPRPKGWRNAALKAYGNAIVPQVAAQIMRAIKYVEE